MSSLTVEQRQRIEQNRLKALERRAASQKQAANSGQANILPPSTVQNRTNGSFTKKDFYKNSSANNYNEANSHSKQANGISSVSKKKFPQKSPQSLNELMKAPSGNRLTGSFRLLSQERFVVDIGYNSQVIEIFKSIPSKLYDVKARQWSFHIEDHDKLVNGLAPLRPDVCVGPLPNLVLKALKEAEKYPPFSSIDLMGIDHLLLEALMPFQRDAVCFGISRGGRVLIADDMGLGKTIQALGIAAFYRREWPLLVVTQSSIRYSWAESIERWIGSISSHDISVINSGKDNLEGEVIIMTYDLLSRRGKEVQDIGFKVVILDESHMLKNFKTARYKAVAPVMLKANRLILLSGTPALSRPSELYTQISGVNKGLFPYFQEYGIRYCGGKHQAWGWDFSGSSNMEELQVILSSTIMIRRLKSEVIAQLPPKQRMTIVLDPSSISNGSKALKEASAHFKGTNGSGKHGALLQYFQESASVKCKAICKYVEELLEDDKKFLIYAHHRVVLDELCKTCIKARTKFMRIDGSTPAETRQKEVDNFQNNPSVKVAVLSITAANTGLTLTSAQLVVFGELFWNPGLLIQAEDRVHRIGQVDSVLIQYLVAKGTADDEIWPLIQSKLDVLNKAGLSNSNFKESTSAHQKVHDQGILKYISSVKTKDISDHFSPKKSDESVKRNHTEGEDLFDDSLWEAFDGSFDMDTNEPKRSGLS